MFPWNWITTYNMTMCCLPFPHSVELGIPMKLPEFLENVFQTKYLDIIWSLLPTDQSISSLSNWCHNILFNHNIYILFHISDAIVKIELVVFSIH